MLLLQRLLSPGPRQQHQPNTPQAPPPSSLRPTLQLSPSPPLAYYRSSVQLWAVCLPAPAGACTRCDATAESVFQMNLPPTGSICSIHDDLFAGAALRPRRRGAVAACCRAAAGRFDVLGMRCDERRLNLHLHHWHRIYPEPRKQRCVFHWNRHPHHCLVLC